MSEKKDLVAVMLPREEVRRLAELGPGKFARTMMACKKALRPEPPTMATIECIKSNAQLGWKDRHDAAKWYKHVLEHGWEPGDHD